MSADPEDELHLWRCHPPQRTTATWYLAEHPTLGWAIGYRPPDSALAFISVLNERGTMHHLVHTITMARCWPDLPALMRDCGDLVPSVVTAAALAKHGVDHPDEVDAAHVLLALTHPDLSRRVHEHGAMFAADR